MRALVSLYVGFNSRLGPPFPFLGLWVPAFFWAFFLLAPCGGLGGHLSRPFSGLSPYPPLLPCLHLEGVSLLAVGFTGFNTGALRTAMGSIRESVLY